MHYSQIILRPLNSEKSTFVKEGSNQIVFYVHQKANKVEIQQAVEKAFDVKVTAVNVVVQKPSKKQRQGRVIGRVAGWKKAYVTLAAGEKLEIYEGV